MQPNTPSIQLVYSNPDPAQGVKDLSEIAPLIDISDLSKPEQWVEKLPFGKGDTTTGSETELQTAVVGSRRHVDLARCIEVSHYFKNMVRRANAGEAPAKRIEQLKDFLESPEQVWEHSWVRFPIRLLNAYASRIFSEDLRRNRREQNSPCRQDADRFTCMEGGETMVRIPVSYLLKLALANAIGAPGTPDVINATGREMMSIFINDNTSPETHSFHPVGLSTTRRVGRTLAIETLMRYLLTQLLTQYANQSFDLEQLGQKVLVYFAPHPPIRQKALNDLISDTFYRELYMSPCLSGWDCGEDKHRYMSLCHQVLSRSQLNTLAKLKEAGIIPNNLVVLPNTSNISLANNGTHISLGSRTLTRLMSDPKSGYGVREEKYYGDLVLKICEHFLPLFVGTYSAAPYRLDFWDFHPERALGFLPHELDYTHLRMLWRRWKGKAKIRVLGRPLTPFGPEWLDRTISRIFRLKGDFVTDFRLLDYLVALLSTDESPAQDGRLGNEQRLLADLREMGVFDNRMPLYQLCRLRPYQAMGFSGFEARYFSLFDRIVDDMGAAADLNILVTMLAYKYIFSREATHQSIPDSPTVESERRQFFFGTAIGIPTFYVHKNSPNRFLHKIIEQAPQKRVSRRYTNYIRIPGASYRSALVRLIRKDGADLIDLLQLGTVVHDLERRLAEPDVHAAGGRLTQQIMHRSTAKRPLGLNGRRFNQTAEKYYREDLRQQHIKEAFHHFKNAVKQLDSWHAWRSGNYNQAMLTILEGKNATDYLEAVEKQFIEESLPQEVCRMLIHLMLLVFHQTKHAEAMA